ncbi:MAG: hypothetical protein AB7L90_18815 [Hyphomicrobiaceae bacterium]
MTLGALIARLETEEDATAMIEALCDLVLYAEIAAAAERYGETPGEYLASCVGQFAAGATDEDWLGLIAAVERTTDPGKAAIGRILRWAIARDQAHEEPGTAACSCKT